MLTPSQICARRPGGDVRGSVSMKKVNRKKGGAVSVPRNSISGGRCARMIQARSAVCTTYVTRNDAISQPRPMRKTKPARARVMMNAEIASEPPHW